MGIITLYKPIGKTPLDMIKCLNEKKATYAGRLDPMAHGLLIILTNEHCLNQKMFHNMNKIYRFELLIGFETDTLDILGIIKNHCDINNISTNNIIKILNETIGITNQEYPIYSSYIVNKKPLWWWAKNNKIDLIEIPSRQIEIYALDLIKHTVVNGNVLKQNILNKLYSLGDRNNNFREIEIIKSWSDFKFKDSYNVFTINAHVSSGTYIRQLCKTLSNKMNTIGIALDIYREKIADFEIK